MGYLRPILKSSPFRFLVAPTRRAWAKVNDTALNIDTIRSRSPQQQAAVPSTGRKSRYSDAVAYETPDYWYLRRIRRVLVDGDTSNEVFIDIGAGKGRIVCLIAQCPFKKVVGVELNEQLCAEARDNADRLRGRRSPVEIVHEDAATADLSEGTIYFLFNPFGQDTLRSVCENIARSLQDRPRRIRIVYYNSVHEQVIESCEWLQRYDTFDTQNGLRVTFWTNTC